MGLFFSYPLHKKTKPPKSNGPARFCLLRYRRIHPPALSGGGLGFFSPFPPSLIFTGPFFFDTTKKTNSSGRPFLFSLNFRTTALPLCPKLGVHSSQCQAYLSVSQRLRILFLGSLRKAHDSTARGESPPPLPSFSPCPPIRGIPLMGPPPRTFVKTRFTFLTLLEIDTVA